MADLLKRVKQLGLAHVQLALEPLMAADEPTREVELQQLRESGLTLTAGMISFPGEDYSTIATIRKTGGFVPDDAWPQRREMSLKAGELCQQLGMKMLSTHIGFVPPSSDGKYDAMVRRVCEVAEPLAEKGVDLLMETGQEGASELLQFLNDLRCRNVAVNFDPANMILYGAGDVIEAIGILDRHIRHVHVKDANLSDQPRMKWGDEVPFGSGQVRPDEFVTALERSGYDGPLMIEREAGSDRMRDIQAAINSLMSIA
jgi:L-ribulose-5-phosphate 3-epimerase